MSKYGCENWTQLSTYCHPLQSYQTPGRCARKQPLLKLLASLLASEIASRSPPTALCHLGLGDERAMLDPGASEARALLRIPPRPTTFRPIISQVQDVEAACFSAAAAAAALASTSGRRFFWPAVGQD